MKYNQCGFQKAQKRALFISTDISHLHCLQQFAIIISNLLVIKRYIEIKRKKSERNLGRSITSFKTKKDVSEEDFYENNVT